MITNARPMTDASGIAPKSLLSDESHRLSPMTKAGPSGTVIGVCNVVVPLRKSVSR